MTAPVDEALVEEVKARIAEALGWDWNRNRVEGIPSALDCVDEAARAVLACLEPRLLPAGDVEAREHYELLDPRYQQWKACTPERARDACNLARVRTVTTIVGPWRGVE